MPDSTPQGPGAAGAAASTLTPSDPAIATPDSIASASVAVPAAPAVTDTVPPPPHSSSGPSTDHANEDSLQAVQTSTRKAAPRPRSSGITVDKLWTLRRMYEAGDLDEAEAKDLVFPYEAELNDKVVLW